MRKIRSRRFKYHKKMTLKTKMILVMALFILMVNLGINTAKYIYNYDSKLAQGIEVDRFKNTIDYSLPIVDWAYNSGKMSFSFMGEIKKILVGIYNFDLDKPETILNRQWTSLDVYYNKSYLPKLEAMQDKSNQSDNSNKQLLPNEKANNGLASSISSEDKEESAQNNNTGVIKAGNIKVQNESKYKIDINELLNEPLKLKFNKSGPKVLIFHTHTTEAYLKNINELNKSGIQIRSSDKRYNVVGVGNKLADYLEDKYNIGVIHNGTVHNYPSDVGAYDRSYNTASKILKSYPSINLSFDIHRDGIDKGKLRLATNVNGKNTAQIMFVVGTDSTGLTHPNWRENLKLALQMQKKLLAIDPDIVRPIQLSQNRYGQHASMGSLIIEIGGDGNTIDESCEATKYIAQVVSEIVKGK